MRLRLILAAACLALLTTAPAHAGEGECGGIAPLENSCTVSFVADGDVDGFESWIGYGIHYTHVEIRSETWVMTSDCDPTWAIREDPCTDSWEGELVQGQLVTITAEVQGVGEWVVGARSE